MGVRSMGQILCYVLPRVKSLDADTVRSAFDLSSSMALITDPSIGIVRDEPSCVLSRLISRRTKSASFQVRPYCSDSLVPVPSEMVNWPSCSGKPSALMTRNFVSLRSVRKRMRPLFSCCCRTSLAGLLNTLPLRSASRKMYEKSARYRLKVAGVLVSRAA